ncbi:MAG: hypothetical protein JWO67_6375 [Streptosporangiaceae bacterium]|jgi:hypothetical protein|nr:hypothetical protein [Streptosporangiaceae bacterium]
MPWVDPHKREGKKVQAHYSTPPWVGTFVFIVAVLFIAAKIGGK